MIIKVEKGNKSSQDKIIRIWAKGEIITIKDILRILDSIFKSEDVNYPISKGLEGRSYFFKAIVDVYSGIPLERVLEKYKLKRKRKKNSVMAIEKRHEIL